MWCVVGLRCYKILNCLCWMFMFNEWVNNNIFIMSLYICKISLLIIKKG